jgi:hypothetical protein
MANQAEDLAVQRHLSRPALRELGQWSIRNASLTAGIVIRARRIADSVDASEGSK